MDQRNAFLFFSRYINLQSSGLNTFPLVYGGFLQFSLEKCGALHGRGFYCLVEPPALGNCSRNGFFIDIQSCALEKLIIRQHSACVPCDSWFYCENRESAMKRIKLHFFSVTTTIQNRAEIERDLVRFVYKRCKCNVKNLSLSINFRRTNT